MLGVLGAYAVGLRYFGRREGGYWLGRAIGSSSSFTGEQEYFQRSILELYVQPF